MHTQPHSMPQGQSSTAHRAGTIITCKSFVPATSVGADAHIGPPLAASILLQTILKRALRREGRDVEDAPLLAPSILLQAKIETCAAARGRALDERPYGEDHSFFEILSFSQNGTCLHGAMWASRPTSIPSQSTKHKEKAPSFRMELMLALPIFTASRPATIVGADELNFCVRDGNRWTLIAINTNSNKICWRKFCS